MATTSFKIPESAAFIAFKGAGYPASTICPSFAAELGP